MKERIDRLFTTHQSMSRSQVRKLLTSWDNDQGRAMAMAEASLAVRPKKYQWSPRLRNAAVTMRYWKLRLRELQYNENYQATFDRWESQIQAWDRTFTLPDKAQCLSIQSVRTRLNQASRDLRAIQKAATDIRSRCFYELLAKYEADNNESTKHDSKRKYKIVQRTIQAEETKALHHKIRSAVKPSEHAALSQIQIPRHVNSPVVTKPGEVHNLLNTASENIIWDTVITRNQIEEHLVHFNKEAFRAAATSPCGHGVIHDALTFTSLSSEAEALLYGEVPPEWYGNNTLLREFLASFQIPETVLSRDCIPTSVSEDDITKGFKSWKESTTTSPSGRHLGHYKAIIQDPILLSCLCKFLNIVISRGISVPRWCNAVNVLIEKDQGQPRINRLRIIHLFEADYNLFLKIMWGSRLVQRALHMNLLNPGQHGSVPGRTTMDPIMLNHLTTDLCRVLKINYVRFDNDASACFDRIIVALGMLAARRCGMPKNAVRSHAKSLELMRYTVKTVYGISETSYRGTPFEPLFGTGQGSGASPAVWLTLVVLLLNTLDRIIPDRISFRSADGSIIHSRLVDAFVDDTALGFTDRGSRSFAELVSSLETIAQTWEKLLHYSGGALNLSKCSWYAMVWDWRKGRPQLRDILPTDPQVQLTQGSSTTPATIQRQDLSQSMRILGVYQNPLGNFTDHLLVLKKKADQFSRCLKSPRLQPSDIRVFHNTVYAPAMRYSLPALAVDEEELGRIQTKIIPAILQRLGFSSKLPTAIRHGPISMGGLGLMDLRTECGIEMVKLFRNAIYRSTEVGKLLILQVQASQLESGIQNPLLEEPNIHLPYLTPNWVLSMRQFMSNHNITITLTKTFSMPLSSSRDQFIMSPERLRGYTPDQQRDINLVRMYLQVTTLSEMTDPQIPNQITLWAIQAHRPAGFLSEDFWPRQLAPSATQRRLWRRFISSQFLRYGRFWKRSPRATLRELSRDQKLDDSATHFDGIPTLIKRLPLGQRRLLSYFHQAAPDDKLWKVLSQKRSITVASDGGLKGHQGTFGWQVQSSANEVLAEGAGPVDGPFDVANSTRCELGGYASALLFLSLLQRMWGCRHKCRIRWVTDSKSAIANVTKTLNLDTTCTNQPDNSDFLAIIKEGTKSTRRKVHPVWVKGHQTTSSHGSKLGRRSHDIICNNRADFLATWYRDHSGKRQSRERTDHVEGAHISISINGIRLVSQVDSCIRYHINGYHLRQYTQAQNKWSNKTWNKVDVEGLGAYRTSLSPKDQSSHTKFMFNQWHTGDKRYQVSAIKDSSLLKCPCCREANETSLHVLQCKSNPEREASIKTFRSTMASREYHPVFRVITISVIAWLNQTVDVIDINEFPSKFRDGLLKALQDQDEIGWEQAIKGFLSVEWRYLLTLGIGDQETEPERVGVQRIRFLLKTFNELAYSLWTARNQTLHGTSEDGMKAVRQEELAEIKEMYQHPELIPAADQHYCEQPLHSILSRSPASRRRWLRFMRMARARLTRDGQRQTLITSFFRTSTG